ncbi:internalin [Flavobacteriaceae bacterium CRH]|nr:internalin [Flavobacteriaceae bacterium CRH]
MTNYGYANCFTYTDCSYTDIVTIPDAKFKAKLVKANANSGNQTVKDANEKYIVVDVNKNGEIEISEALMVYKLNVISSDIATLQGILKFTNITELYCDFNELTTLDISTLTELNDFSCSDNSITTLNITGLKKMTKFSCSSNKIESLNLSALKEIKYLNTYGDQLSTLNINGLTKLESVEIRGNGFARKKTLDLSEFVNLIDLVCSSMELNGLKLPNAPKLERLDCSINYLTSLDVSRLKLKTLLCFRNELTTLDVNNSSNLSTLDCNSNLLQSLFIKVGKAITNLNFLSNYNLNFICTDESQVDIVRFMPIKPGFYCPNVNSYCSFTPGGTYYSINGNTKFDLNANGCDDNDILVSNVKFNILNGINKSEFVADNTGSYFLPTGAGSYSMTPKLENPNYFKISPESITVYFPTETSPLTKNFCVTANGSHQDLEIVILPTVPAVPGFDAKYKLIYKNKGNLTQSGSATLTFDDSVLDLLKSSTSVSSQTTNKLVWDFSNLKPFETREIEIVLNVNSPTEIPAVNNSDILKYTATINSSGTDETPLDNNFEFNQTVVGSYDPNDKTCVEGNVIKSQLIGQYVHYLIRFENKGSYSAKSIVVKDVIDLSKFDISTLIPTSASHSYITKISNNNKVEFVFENINLPFDNANNDGYIAFKIKTLSTLQVGDSFTNDANIYFDYNLPILTNKATSTFQTLGVQNFEFSKYFSLYPNPAKDVLNISLKNDIEIESMSIYDILGRLVIAVPNAKNISSIDVSKLRTGNYLLKIKTDNGSSVAKFIKE